MSEYIEVGQPLQFTDPNTPTRVGEIVENVSDIYNIPSPRLGMQVFVKNEKKSFVITSLKSKTIGGVDVPEAAVEAFEPVGAKSFTWNNDTDPSNMNDFVVAGVYDIKGEHTREDDNLPILNTGGGHTFNARLTVLDSSITGSGNSDDKCITQVLSFCNRLGQGEVYIRTGKGSSLDSLTWEKWSALQRNVNVGQVDNLDNLKDNGIYSGVWTKGSYNAYPLTFVCIVINDYFVGVAPRRISQFVYGLSKFDGSTVYQSRVWDDSKNAWSDWEILNQKKISSMISAEIKKVTDGIDPNKIDSLKDIITWIEEHGGDVTAIYNAIQGNTIKINAEVNRAQAVEAGLGEYISQVEETVNKTNADIAETKKNIASSLHASSVADSVNITGKSDVGRTTFSVEIPAATTEKAGVMTAGDKKKINASIKDIVVNPNVDDVELDLEDNTEKTSHVAFPAATTEKAGVMSAEDKVALDSIPNEIEKLKDGDTIVGQAREIHSRNGKTVADSFLIRTTAGSGTIGDGVASLKSVGGNIVKNLVDGTFGGSYIHKDVKSSPSYPQLYYYASNYNLILNHVYYFSATVKTDGSGSTGNTAVISINNGRITQYSNGVKDMWHNISIVGKYDNQSGDMFIRGVMATYIYVIKPLVIDLTEMFGAGNEPDKATCDKLFGTMDALPQGLTVANPTTFTSTGFNQFNPESVLEGKAIVDNAIVSGDKKIAVIPCLPCKVGVGENNGYCVHGDFGEDIKVYLTPLNPMEVDGELYMHELTKDATTDTYVPLIKGYMLVEVPTTDNLCAHFLWSEDKCKRDSYEPYFESKIELPTIPQMSEWGLAGIQSSGTLACDTIDLERGVYVKRIGSVDFGSLDITKSGTIFVVAKPDNISIPKYGKVGNAVIDRYSIYIAYTVSSGKLGEKGYMVYSDGRLYIKDTTYTDVNAFKQAMQGVMLYYELATPEEYPLPKVDNNYISSDYGVEQFDSVVPCSANNLYYMRSLAGETRNFLDRMYNNTAKTDAKEVADYITNGIEGNKELATNAPNLALRALYVAAGAIYNNSTGYYELNGITDLTESNMIYIYEHKNYHFSLNTARYFQENKNVRTIFPMNSVNTVYDQLFKNNKLSLVCTFMNSGFEVIKLSKAQTLAQVKGIPTESGGMSNMFTNAKKLKTIYPIDVSAVTSIGASFNGTIALIDVRLQGLKCSAAFKDSANISKESILYIIQNATPTTAITITLHADAYARLAEDADIVAALEAQPLITLVSA